MIVQLLTMVFQGVHSRCAVKSSGVWEVTHLFTSGLPPRVMLNSIFYNTSCQGYHNTMINENDACWNDLHWHFKIGFVGKKRVTTESWVMAKYRCKIVSNCCNDDRWNLVIGHGIVGKDIPIMARLAEARHWSKRWQTRLTSPDITATQISDGSKIQVRRRHVLHKDPTNS
jgi:hypothetical protein